MHEYHLMLDLMKKIEAVAAKQRAKKVVRLTVWLGALSHFSKEHFQEHFDQAAKGTLAEGARLELELSDDFSHPQAQGVLLKSVEVKK